ncbi:MAG TPA: hypothetical protein DEG90_00665 [Porphyromonadaceae bacterium]|nr:hypothetical protein [Porphyromonadaceae bacterium]
MNMSRIVKIFVVVVLTGLMNACTNSKESESEIKAVEVDLNKALPLTENVQSVDVMTLKDSETGHLPGHLSKVVFRRDSIFVLDMFKDNGLYVYDSDGKIINSFVNKGEGPEEFQIVWDFNVTPNNIILFDYRSDEPFIFLDRNLNFLRRDKVGDCKDHFFYDSKNDSWWFDRGNYAYDGSDSKLIYKKGSGSKTMLKIPENLKNITFANWHSFAELSGDSLLYMPTTENVVYLCEPDSAEPMYRLDFKGKWYEFKKGDTNEETNDLWNRIAEEGYVNTLDILSDGRNVLHTFNSGDRHYVLIVNTDTYTSRLYYLTEKEHENLGDAVAYHKGQIIFGVPGKLVKVSMKRDSDK